MSVHVNNKPPESYSATLIHGTWTAACKPWFFDDLICLLLLAPSCRISMIMLPCPVLPLIISVSNELGDITVSYYKIFNYKISQLNGVVVLKRNTNAFKLQFFP